MKNNQLVYLCKFYCVVSYRFSVNRKNNILRICRFFMR